MLYSNQFFVLDNLRKLKSKTQPSLKNYKLSNGTDIKSKLQKHKQLTHIILKQIIGRKWDLSKIYGAALYFLYRI